MSLYGPSVEAFSFFALLRIDLRSVFQLYEVEPEIFHLLIRMLEFAVRLRTVYDRLVTVLQLFKRHGLKGLVERSDWPSYVETIRPIYEPEEIAAMLRHADRDEAILEYLKSSQG